MMIGASPPRPKCEISVTAAAKIDATPPSTALPPAFISRAPASTVNVRPAAITPWRPCASPRIDAGACARSTIAPNRTANPTQNGWRTRASYYGLSRLAPRTSRAGIQFFHMSLPRRMLALVAAGEVLGMTLWFSATAAAPAIAAEFALDTGARAWLTMAVQAGFVFGTLVTALTNLADSVNARRLFAAGCVVGALSNVAIAFAPSAQAIIALRFCTGAALAWVYPPGMKIAAGWFRERRGTALGVVVGAVGVGSAFPHLLAWLGTGIPWRLLVGASSALAVGGGLLVALAVQDGPHVSASAPFDRHALRIVLRSRGTRLAMLGYFGHMGELYAMWTWMAAFAAASLVASKGMPAGTFVETGP